MEIRINQSPNNKVIISSSIGTVLTTGAYIYSLAKCRKGKNIFRKISNIELGVAEGITLCGVSTAGGLCGGLLADKRNNRTPKLKEATHQFMGNGIIPFGCLAIVNKLTKGLNKYIRTTCAISTLVLSTFLGHHVVDNILGAKKPEDKYKVGLVDFAPDMDDWILAASTVINNKGLYKITATVCPFTYMVLGIKTGLAQKENKKLDKEV